MGAFFERYKDKSMRIILTLLLAAMLIPGSAFAQGSIFGVVANSDLSTPTNGQISFVGYIDDSDNEVRTELSIGAGYDAGNWFDDFQNYLTESPGNPYDYIFYNFSNNQGLQLSSVIPNNSFQQENVLLASVSWPAIPTSLVGTTVSGSSVVLSWNKTTGNTYHVYRRLTTAGGSFFRLDNTLGLLSDRGVVDSFFVDNTTDGVSSYDYMIVAEDDSGNWSPHSLVAVVNSSSVIAPTLASVAPTTGTELGGTAITVSGSNFDIAGVELRINSVLVPSTVVSPYELTATTLANAPGPVDINVTNTSSALVSNTLVGGFTYSADGPPVLAAIGAQATTENIQLLFGVSAVDPDGLIPTLTTSALPAGAIFIDSANGAGSFDWTPTFLDAGVYSVTFYTSDGLQVDSEVVAITVNEAGNQTPTLAVIGPQTATENVLFEFAVSATDADATIPTLSTSALPTGAVFTDSANGAGALSWTPDFTQAGVYNITVFASDGLATDSEIVVVTVNDGGNQTPVLAAIGAQSTTENVILEFSVGATDLDGTIPTLTTSALPSGAIFTDSANGAGALSWTPDFTQAGVYNITILASDGLATDSEIVVVTVIEAGNQAPVLAAIGAQATTENILLEFAITASDLDGTIPTLTTSALPIGAIFTDSSNGVGSFNWTPDFTQAGVYNITFFASDGLVTDSEVVVVTVTDGGNQTPVLVAIGAQATNEDSLLEFSISASDLDGTIPTLTTSALPTGAIFTDSANGVGSLSWTPDFTQSGSYFVTFYASDGIATDSELVSITVNEIGNQVPVMSAIGPQVLTENVQFLLNISSTDPDGTIPVLTTSALPSGALFTDSLNGAGLFDWTPGFTDAGVYSVTFYTSDGALVDSEVVSITVNDGGNQTPVLAAIGPQATDENLLLTFAVTATDPDLTIPTLSTSTLPVGALFIDNGDGTGSFNWTPSFIDAGLYNITFYAADSLAIDSEVVVITVNEVGNQPPVLDSTGNKIVTEGVQLLFAITASDMESIPTITSSALPVGATLFDSANGLAIFDWTPTFADSGVYNITLYATDDSLAVDSELITITVGEAGSQSPVITTIADTTVNEGDQLVVNVSAFDPEGTGVIIQLVTTLNNFAFVDSGNGSAVLTYSPDFFDAGVDSITFIATDLGTPQLSTSVTSQVITMEVNQTPSIDSLGPFAVLVGDTLTFDVFGSDSTDPFVRTLYMTATSLPVNATYADNFDNSGSFVFAPVGGQEGLDTVTFIATDKGTPQLSISFSVEISVVASNNIPVLSAIGPQIITEGANLAFTISATDADGTIPYFTIDSSALRGIVSFTDNGDGTADFSFVPDFIQSGITDVTFYAHDGIDFDKELVLIQVYDAGDQVPQFDPLPSPSVLEGTVGEALITAFDPDTLPISIFITDSVLPPNFIFFDSGNGSAVLTMVPDFTQAGVYIIGIAVSDGTLADSTTFVVTIDEAGNQIPVLAPIADQSTKEANALAFSISATDLDGIPILTMFSSTVAGNAALIDNGDGTGDFSWTPSNFDSGQHVVTFYATDDADPLIVDSQSIIITVADSNITPNYFIPPFQQDTLVEGTTLTFEIYGFDVDGTFPTIRAFLDGTDTLATNMSTAIVIDSANNQSILTLTFSPDFTQGSTPTPEFYYVSFEVCDEYDTTLCRTTPPKALRVYNLNQAPVMTVSNGGGPFNILEGTLLTFGVITSDDAGLIDSTVASGLPTNATFTGAIANQKFFSFTPDFTQSGQYFVTFTAFDSEGLTDVSVVEINVIDAGNQTPLLTTNIPNDTQLVYLGGVDTTVLTATDPDMDSITISASLPSTNMGLVWSGTPGNASGLMIFQPDQLEQFIIYAVDYTVTDVPSGASTVVTKYYYVLPFLRGDSDSDNKYTLNDVVFLINYLFKQGPEPDPIAIGDADNSGSINVADIAYLVNYLYHEGPAPPQ